MPEDMYVVGFTNPKTHPETRMVPHHPEVITDLAEARKVAVESTNATFDCRVYRLVEVTA